MVQLVITSVVKIAIDEYCKRKEHSQAVDDLAKTEIGGPIEHHSLLQISKYLVQLHENNDINASEHWRADALLKGTSVYKAPQLPKKEPVSGLAPFPPYIANKNSSDGRLQSIDAAVEEARRATPVRAHGQPSGAA